MLARLSCRITTAWRWPIHIDNDYQESNLTWIVVVVGATVSFWLLLARHSWEFMSFPSGQSNTWIYIFGFVALLGTVYSDYRRFLVAYKVFSIVLFIVAVCLFAIFINNFWTNPTKNSFVVGGLIPGNDAAAWLQSAWHFLQVGEISGMGVRRPLDTGLRALVLVIAGNLQASIAFTAFIAGLVSLISAVQVRNSFGWLAGAGFYVTVLLLICHHLPLSMTAVHGFIFGNIAFSCLWQAATKESAILWLLGLATLGIGLDLRPGPFLILPGVLCFGFVAIVRCRQQKLGYVVMSMFAFGAGYLCSGLVTQLWVSGDSLLHENFPYHLYGMAVGGQGWESALRDYPGITPSELIKKSLEIMVGQPGLFLGFYTEQLVEFFRLFIRYEMGMSRIVTAISIVWLFCHRREPLAQLLILGGIGIWVSAPFLMMDAGDRVFATVFPFFAILTAISISIAIRVIAYGLSPKAVQYFKCIRQGKRRNSTNLAVLASLSIALALIAPTLAIALSEYPYHADKFNKAACHSYEKSIVVSGTNSAMLKIVRNRDPISIRVPILTRSLLLKTLPVDGGDGQNGEIYRAINNLTAPYTLLTTYDVERIRRLYIVVREDLLNGAKFEATLCVNNAKKELLYTARPI